MSGFRLRLLLVAASVGASGCAGPSDRSALSSGVAKFHSAGPDVTCDFELYGASFVPAEERSASLVADVGRCRVIETDDGRSRLYYPAGPADRPAVRSTFTVTFATAGQYDGSLDLTPTAFRPVRQPQPTGERRDAIVAALVLPAFLAQPFAALPDRLATAVKGPDPVPPAVVELARDLVADGGIAMVGTVRNTGVLACRLAATDAGRAKLRAALGRRDAVTRPAGAQPADR